MSALLRRLLSIRFILFLCAAASAQETWTSVPSPTTENLWGVCYGGNQFVAVGGGGTILTSPDGTVWTARVSGTTEWLLSVCYGDGLYVAVGDHGTILTSPDAIAWTDHSIGGPRLNGVMHWDGLPASSIAGGPWFAVGESATIVAAAPDGIRWTAQVASFWWPDRDKVTWLRGIAPVGDHLFFWGGGGITGRVIFSWRYIPIDSAAGQNVESYASTPDQNVFVGGGGLMRATDTTHAAMNVAHDAGDSYFRGVVIAGGAIIAVGEHGVICASPGTWDVSVRRVASPTTENLNALAADPDIVVAVGDHGAAVRSVLAHRPPLLVHPLTEYQNVPVEENTSLHAVFGGSPPLAYEWKRNGLVIPGASGPSLIVPKSELSYGGGVYAVTATNAFGSATSSTKLQLAHAAPSGRVSSLEGFHRDGLDLLQSIEPLSGGGILVARIPADPSLAWLDEYPVTAHSFSAHLQANGGFSRTVSQPDGKVLVLGGFTRVGGKDTAGAVRLNPDGSVDSTYTGEGVPADAIMLPGGRLIGLTLGPNTVTLKRFTSSGALDLSYHEPVIALPPANDFLAPGRIYSQFTAAQAPDGRIFIAITNSAILVGTSYAGANESVLLRLRADGTVDPAFSLVHLPDNIRQLVVTAESLYYRAVDDHQSLGLEVRSKIRRLKPDGAADAAYPGLQFSWAASPGTASPLGATPVPMVIVADGSVLTLHARAIERFDSNGVRDLNYSAHLDTLATSATQLVPLSDGAVLLQGDFTQVNGVPAAGLARIIPRTDEYATRLVNLSVRSSAGAGEDTVIAGFVVAGTQGSRSVLVRGVGPGLIPYDIPAAAVLSDPALALYRGADLVASNEDWPAALLPTANAVGAFSLASGSEDAALSTTLAPANYTAHLAGHGAETGIALAEIYDATPIPASSAAARLVNLSGRATLRRTDDVIIAGFAVDGPLNKRVLVRAVGPSLRDYGVSTPLADPRLTIYKAQQALAQNDDWQVNDARAFDEVGAFRLTGSKDAALVIDLPPGAYTAVASSADGTPGIVLVEIYEVP